MAGYFKQIGEARFPGIKRRPQCSLYEWGTTGPGRCGRFSIRFLSPDGEAGPRVYYVVPLLREWMGGRHVPFLDDACRYGFKVLTELENLDQDHRDFYRLCLALFRNRRNGRNHIGRRFRHAIDFVDTADSRVIVPGLGGKTELDKRPRTTHQKARELLLDALPQSGGTGRGEQSWLPAILHAYEEPWAGQKNSSLDDGQVGDGRFVFPLQALPWRSELDLLFTDGTLRSSADFDWRRTVASVRSSLIYGEATESAGLPRIANNRELSKGFVAKLKREALARTPGDFDRWLKVAREHGFLSLLGGTRLSSAAKAELAMLGHYLYGGLMWTAYTLMARCWGALMFLVSFVSTPMYEPGESTVLLRRAADALISVFVGTSSATRKRGRASSK